MHAVRVLYVVVVTELPACVAVPIAETDTVTPRPVMILVKGNRLVPEAVTFTAVPLLFAVKVFVDEFQLPKVVVGATSKSAEFWTLALYSCSARDA